MITYELAKQLKDAGFPFRQTKSFKLRYFDKNGEGVSFSFISDRDFPRDFSLYIPTLSELIEACGDKFNCLYKVDGHSAKAPSEVMGGWEALASNEDSLNNFQYGSTPEEAVAKLWLELNK